MEDKRGLPTKLKRRVGNAINRLEKSLARQALAQKGLTDFLKAGPPVGSWDGAPDHADLWYLYRLVRRRKPETIIEFGSGCSTIILAQALFDNAMETEGRPGFLHSLDVSEKWAQVTRENLPGRLESFCEVRHTSVIVVDHHNTPVYRHQNVPEVPLDMIYLDGPPLLGEVKIAVDPIDLEPLFRPGFALCVDGRRKNVEYLKQHLQRRYKFQANRIRNNPTFHLID